MNYEKIKKEIKDFVDERDWEQFHTPKNLSMALSVEASELLEIFQWQKAEEYKNATEEQIENKLIENWCLTSHLQSIGLRNLHKFWDKEKNEMVYELRYALSDVIEHPHATTQLFFCIATEEDSEDENKRYRLKRERYAIEAMEG